jgi:polyphosphate glucokinase
VVSWRQYDALMASSKIPVLEQILAIDIGATNIKFCHVDHDGEILEKIRRRPTPYPCTPARLVEVLSRRIVSAQCPRVGAGFPGEFADGHVVRPGNLSRPGGISTDVDAGLDQKWRSFGLQEALCEATQRDVRVVNDAALAALGCFVGVDTELVLTLGTGLGLALGADGQLKKVRDVGAAPFLDGRTYDEVLGERSRARNEALWRKSLGQAIAGFVEEFGASTMHLAGGNARRVSPASFTGWSWRVVINGNEAALRGVARLFYG